MTSVDVAREAGVSQSTVSLVFSGKGAGRVSPATADAVRAAARTLGYRPNAAARALKSGAARAVGLIVPDVTNPFFARVLRGAQRGARSTGHAVMLVEHVGDRAVDDEAVEALLASAVDGFLFFGAEPPAAVRADPHVHSVVVEATSRDVPFVRCDVGAGATAAMDHLLGLGHRRIAHLRAAAYADETFRLRAAAWERALRGAGEEPADELWAATTIGFAAARDAAHELLSREPRPTSLLCDDDLIAGGAYIAARGLGLNVPADLSIVGFDDLDYTVVLDPPPTTVRLDAEELGAQAFAVLAERLDGGRPASRVLGVELIVRGSTAPPP